jgi:hypothetical protein
MRMGAARTIAWAGAAPRHAARAPLRVAAAAPPAGTAPYLGQQERCAAAAGGGSILPCRQVCHGAVATAATAAAAATDDHWERDCLPSQGIRPGGPLASAPCCAPRGNPWPAQVPPPPSSAAGNSQCHQAALTKGDAQVQRYDCEVDHLGGDPDHPQRLQLWQAAATKATSRSLSVVHRPAGMHMQIPTCSGRCCC